jgi:hypothetical protein
MKRGTSAVVLVLLTCLPGCSLQHTMDSFAPETVQHAKASFDYLRYRQFDLITPNLDPSIDPESIHDKLDEMTALIPAQNPASEKTVGAHFTCDYHLSHSWCDYSVILEYQFPSQWILVYFVERKQDGKFTITTFHVTQKSQSLEETNRFTLFDKDPLQYAILVAGLGSFALMLYTLILCIRTPIRKRKWLWIILVLLGICKIGVNWTTGAAIYQILFLAILPFGWTKELYGPCFLYASLPLGALLFLTFRDRVRAPEAPAQPAGDITPVTSPHIPSVLE